MNSSALAARLACGPHIPAESAAEQRLKDWLAELAPAQSAEISAWLDRPFVRAILLGIAEFSPYLFDLIRADAARLARLLACDPEQHLAALIEKTARDVLVAPGESDVMQQPVKTAMRFAGRRFIKEYPYRDAYLLDDARRVRAEIGLPMILLGGITDRASMDLAMREGFEFVAMGRALLREPDLVNRIAADASTPSLCIHCNRCMPTIYDGTRCVVVAGRG